MVLGEQEKNVLPNLAQNPKYINFKTGNHNSFIQSLAMFPLHHSLTRFTVWDVAPSYCRAILFSPERFAYPVHNYLVCNYSSPVTRSCLHQLQRDCTFFPMPLWTKPGKKLTSIARAWACYLIVYRLWSLHHKKTFWLFARPGQWLAAIRFKELEILYWDIPNEAWLCSLPSS